MGPDRLRALAPLVLGGLLPLSGAAQIVDGRVVAERTEEPIQGAVVELLDPRGEPVAAAVTNEAGRVLLAAPTVGAFRLRARHIAYREVEAGPLTLEGEDALEVVLRLSEDVLELEPLEVVGRRGWTRTRPPGTASGSGRPDPSPWERTGPSFGRIPRCSGRTPWRMWSGRSRRVPRRG